MHGKHQHNGLSLQNYWASHMHTLMAVLLNTTGPILEMGMGLYSTAVTSSFAFRGRYVRSVEQNGDWVLPLLKLNDLVEKVRSVDPNEYGGTHDIKLVDSYDDAVVDDVEWDVVFLDHGPPKRRAVDAARVRNNCNILVAHDAYDGDDYDYPKVLPTFAYGFRDNIEPCTAVVSDKPLDKIMDFLGPHVILNSWRPAE